MTERPVDTVIAGGTLVTATETHQASLAIRGETIVAIGPPDRLPPATRTVDATGKLVLPGAIDCHVHLGGPEYDDYRVGPHIAARAGLTTLLVFGFYDAPGQEPLPDAVRRLQAEIAREAVLDVGLHLILSHQPHVLAGIPEAIRLGVTSFKLFMTYKKRPLRMCPDDFICRVMEVVARHGGLTQLHCENGDVLDYLEDRARQEGRVAPADFPATCPDWAEAEAINRAILFGQLTGSPVYVVHLSTQLGLERIKQAQAAGQRVWTETCPQYLLLSDAEMARWGPFAKIGPPLRAAAGPDREALWAGTAAGHIAAVGSDHAARAPRFKEPGWQNIFVGPAGQPIPFGNPGLETLVPLLYTAGVVERGLGLPWLARVLAENPARIFGLYPRKGALRVGADADLLLIDPAATWTVRAADHQGLAGYTLFEGRPLRGRPWMTFLRGQVLLNQGRVEQAPGYGRYLPRTGPLPPLAGAAR